MRESKPRSPLRGLKVALVAGLAASTGGCVMLDDLIGDIFGRSMRDQPSLDAYDDPRPPADGAVPFASPNFPAEPGQSGLGQPEPYDYDPPPPVTQADVVGQADVVMELENPVDATEESLERGEEKYNVYCAPCHAVEGDGTGAVTAAGYPEWSLLEEGVAEYPDGYIYSIARVGRGLMPAYQHQLDHFDRWHVVNYVRELQAAALGDDLPEPTSDPDGGDPGDGNGEDG